MTDAPAEETAKSSKLPLLIGLVLALAGGGGGFYATYAGMLDGLLGGREHETSDAGHGAPDEHAAPARAAPSGDITFVPIDPITINLGPRGDSRHLRFAAQLEVPGTHAQEVATLMPRIMDVLNIYLRALDPHELEEPAALLRLRAQMLRRVQIVTGPGFVNDLLVMEFVFN
ncbi:MAG: flagellar basal body-associated FliL family protein [Pararhodobacter sp.]